MLEELSELEYHHFKQVNHHLYHLWAIFNSYIEFFQRNWAPTPRLVQVAPEAIPTQYGRWVYTNIRHNQARYITDNGCCNPKEAGLFGATKLAVHLFSIYVARDQK